MVEVHRFVMFRLFAGSPAATVLSPASFTELADLVRSYRFAGHLFDY